jgi:ABC-type antimicrobial peptide transport system permease subunit
VAYYEEVVVANPTIIDVFSYPFVSGSPNDAMAAPNSMIISQKMASKYFPDEDAVGNILKYNNQHDFVITGVVENIPHNSSLKFDFLISTEFERQTSEDDASYYDSWLAWSSRTYVKVMPGVSAGQLTGKISDMILDRFEDGREARLSAINITDLYFKFSNAKTGIAIFFAIAVAILILACINFINLSTARYRLRSKETGIRKVVGAQRGSLIIQFLCESFILTCIGFFAALGIVEIALPFFNSLFQLQLTLNLFNDSMVILASAGVLIITAVMAGIYPALSLSRYHPVQIFRSNFGSDGKNLNLRRTLVIIQFSITVILLVSIAVIYTQINFIKDWDAGYEREYVINISLRGESGDNFEILKQSFKRNPDIISVTGGAECLPYWYMYTRAKWDGLSTEDGKRVSMNFVGYDFARTYGIEMVDGRDFDETYATDVKQGCVINETLAHMMNQNPILGADINVWGERKVIGVIKDFNFTPLDNAIEPLAIMMLDKDNLFNSNMRVLTARIGSQNITAALDYMRDSWEEILPNHPFEYSFLDEQFDASYKSMEQMRNLAACFGILAIIIAGLGLFGLASFTTEQKTKEIGIRKVFGASIGNIVGMLSREFVVLIIVANLIALPVSWFLMNRWLEDYAYHAELNIGLLFLVGCFTLVIALLSVFFQAVRAALTDPVKSIAHE